MEISPLITALFILLASLSWSAWTLRIQASLFEPLTTRTRRFDCVDPLNTITVENAQESIHFAGVTENCMLPNLFKDRADEVSRVEELFATLVARCTAGECQ